MEHGDLEAVEAIKQVKFAYFRLLDLKQFDDLGRLLTEGCTADYEDGRHHLEGREAIVTFLTESLADRGVVSEHHGHHPEIDVRPDGTATGLWYLQDRVLIPAADLEIGGTALYRDEYLMENGRWLISHTGYERIFEERRVHSTMALRSLKSRF